MTSQRAVVAVVIATLLVGCVGGGGAGPSDAASANPTKSQSATPEPTVGDLGASAPAETEVAVTEPPAPVRTSEPLGNIDVSYLPPDPVRFRRDTGTQGAQHWLPVNVVEDDEAERWGDWFLFPATVAYDKSGNEQPLPEDPVSWLREHPNVKVLDKRKLEVDGRPAVLLDVKRKGGLLLGGEGFAAPEGDGYERFVLWQVDDTWVVAQASTFLGSAGLTQKDAADDAFMSYLAALRFE